MKAITKINEADQTARCMARAEVAALNLPAKAHFLAWAIETILGIMFFIILYGQIAYPLYLDVSTTGWDEYSLLMWGFMMFIALAAFVIRVIQSAKAGYEPVF